MSVDKSWPAHLQNIPEASDKIVRLLIYWLFLSGWLRHSLGCLLGTYLADCRKAELGTLKYSRVTLILNDNFRVGLLGIWCDSQCCRERLQFSLEIGIQIWHPSKGTDLMSMEMFKIFIQYADLFFPLQFVEHYRNMEMDLWDFLSFCISLSVYLNVEL